MKELITIIIAAFLLFVISDWLDIMEFVGGFLAGLLVATFIKVRKYDKK